jgi:hydrogenase maturation protein HypF
MGRLFDGVAALVGVRQTVNYEAQAAIELEALVDPAEKGQYDFQITDDVVDPAPMFGQIIADLEHQLPIEQISAKFHNTIAEIALQTCLAIRSKTDINLVALSGGVWQNMVLLQTTIKKLRKNSFSIYYHDQVPTNDGGLSLGQAVIAYHTIID